MWVVACCQFLPSGRIASCNEGRRGCCTAGVEVVVLRVGMYRIAVWGKLELEVGIGRDRDSFPGPVSSIAT